MRAYLSSVDDFPAVAKHGSATTTFRASASPLEGSYPEGDAMRDAILAELTQTSVSDWPKSPNFSEPR